MWLSLTRRAYQSRRVVAETQSKPGNLFQALVEGKESMKEKKQEKKKKTKTNKKQPQKESWKTRELEWCSVMESCGAEGLWRTWRGRPLKMSLSSKEELFWRIWWENRLWDVSTPRMPTANLQTSPSVTSMHSSMLCAEKGLQGQFIKMKWLLQQVEHYSNKNRHHHR